jgi:hypothetical protein
VDEDVTSATWLGLEWSPWMTLEEATEAYRARSPRSEGIYRMRARDQTGLIYIGETGVGIRQRLQHLVKGIDYVRRGVRIIGGPPRGRSLRVRLSPSGSHYRGVLGTYLIRPS